MFYTLLVRKKGTTMLYVMHTLTSWARRCKHDVSGQGTTEYAILVGVLVVMAIIAVVAFRDKVQELWTSISESMQSL